MSEDSCPVEEVVHVDVVIVFELCAVEHAVLKLNGEAGTETRMELVARMVTKDPDSGESEEWEVPF